MRRPQRRTLAWIGAVIGCLVVLGIIYQYQRHPKPSGSKAVATVKAELASRGVPVNAVSCQANHLDPTSLPAITQVASLHPDETPLLYDCTADLSGKPPAKEPGHDEAWCVLGFTGSAPWVAYSTEHGCPSMVGKA